MAAAKLEITRSSLARSIGQINRLRYFVGVSKRPAYGRRRSKANFRGGVAWRRLHNFPTAARLHCSRICSPV